MKQLSRRTLFAALFAGVLAGFLPAQASAQAVDTEILVIHAKEEAGEIDARLQEMQALSRAPFNAFRTMRVLETSSYQLAPENPREITLPNGRRLRIELARLMPDGRMLVKVAINRPGQNDYLPLLQVRASPGDPFFVAGQRHDGGTLVIGIRLGARP